MNQTDLATGSASGSDLFWAPLLISLLFFLFLQQPALHSLQAANLQSLIWGPHHAYQFPKAAVTHYYYTKWAAQHNRNLLPRSLEARSTK